MESMVLWTGNATFLLQDLLSKFFELGHVYMENNSVPVSFPGFYTDFKNYSKHQIEQFFGKVCRNVAARQKEKAITLQYWLAFLYKSNPIKSLPLERETHNCLLATAKLAQDNKIKISQAY